MGEGKLRSKRIELSAISFPSEALAPAEKRDFIRQMVALSPGSNLLVADCWALTADGYPNIPVRTQGEPRKKESEKVTAKKMFSSEV